MSTTLMLIIAYIYVLYVAGRDIWLEVTGQQTISKGLRKTMPRDLDYVTFAFFHILVFYWFGWEYLGLVLMGDGLWFALGIVLTEWGYKLLGYGVVLGIMITILLSGHYTEFLAVLGGQLLAHIFIEKNVKL